MAKHIAKCPKCGSRVDLDTAVGERIICANCQASLSLPGKGKGHSKADPLVGKTLGEFEVAELLSRDRFGAVYRARQPSLDRLVLLRVLEGARAADAELAEALKHRARAAAGIHHGNVIQILAVGEAEGLLFVTTEHAEGETLAAVLSRGGLLSPACARQYLKEAASALAAVHEAGIVHGHIRPANILIDLKGTARLSSLDLPAQGVAGETAAREDVPLGALIYAAPEVISGMTPGAAADLYSLGATFYHLLAGRPPHECETASELATKHITETPPLLARIAPKADRRLTRIIDRLICKSPSARAPSAQTLVEELETLGPLRADAPRAAPPREPVAQTTAPHAGEAEKMVHTQRRGQYVPVRLLVRGAVVVGLIVGIICLWRVIVGQWKTYERGPTARTTGADAERAASKLLEKTKACIEQQEWETATHHLGRLERFAETSFYGEHHEEILNLRRTATAEADAARKAEMEGEASGADGKGRLPKHPMVAGKKLAPGFVIAYYDRPDRRRFFRAEVAQKLRFEWGRGSPAEGVPANFAAHIVGWLRIAADDRYTFRFSAVSGARLHLDGKLVLDAWDIDYLNEVARVDLGQGWHPLWIEYKNWHSGAFLMLHCARGTGERRQWWTLSDDLLYCEADLLTRVQDHPTEDPLVGREPQAVGGPVLAPQSRKR